MPLRIPETQEIASRRWIERSRGSHSKWSDRAEFDPTEQVMLVLSLYNDNFFDVPRVGVVQEGWRADWVKTGFVEGERVTYEVTEDQWTKFEDFLHLAEDNFFELLMWPRFSVAAGRYLRASFARGTNFFPLMRADHYKFDGATGEEVLLGAAEPDERSLKEEVLLNYFFALEALVGEQDRVGRSSKKSTNPAEDRVGASRKTSTNPAEKIAFMIGSDDAEQSWIKRFLTSAYDDRCDIVHEGYLQRETADLRVLRRCCQRALGVIFILDSQRKLSEVQSIISGQASTKAVEATRAARRKLFGLISDPTKLDKWVSPISFYKARVG